MDLKTLEKYCTEQGIKQTAKAMKNIEKVDVSSYHRGQANVFFWVAACIQNDTIPEEVTDCYNFPVA